MADTINNDAFAHGTHVSGTAAGKRVGVAPEANLFHIKVLDDNGKGSDDNFLCGVETLRAAMDAGHLDKKTVLSASLGGPCGVGAGRVKIIQSDIPGLSLGRVALNAAATTRIVHGVRTSKTKPSRVSAQVICPTRKSRAACSRTRTSAASRRSRWNRATTSSSSSQPMASPSPSPRATTETTRASTRPRRRRQLLASASKSATMNYRVDAFWFRSPSARLILTT